jgi:hypothetical protein
MKQQIIFKNKQKFCFYIWNKDFKTENKFKTIKSKVNQIKSIFMLKMKQQHQILKIFMSIQQMKFVDFYSQWRDEI